MVPDARAAERVAAGAAQVGLAAVVLAAPGATEGLGLRAYGLAILAVPSLVAAATGRPVTPWQRLLVAAVIALHPLGGMYGVYRGVWWYDHVAHGAAGLVLAGGAYRLLGRVADDVTGPRRHLAALGVVLAVGATWEVYESAVPWLTVYGGADVVADLACDAAGWALALPVRGRLLATLGTPGPEGSSGDGPAPGADRRPEGDAF